MPADLYDVLGVPADAPAEELKRAYRERVRKYHPDVNDHPDGEAQFKLVKTAHDVLSDPAERKTYDRLGHHEYVEKHLDSLPPVSVFPEEDLPDGATTDEGSTETDPATSEPVDGTTESSTGSPADTSTGTTTGDRSSGSTASTGSSGGYGGTGSGTSTTDASSSTAGTTTAESSTDRSDDGATATGTDRDSWDAAASSTRTATADSSVPEGVRRRRGLKRWYGVVVLSLLLYVGGLGAYALPRRVALRSFLGDVAASPIPTFLGTFPLSSPTEYVLAAVRTATAGTPTLGLVLLAGTVVLPLVVLTTVGRFGRGAAWVYALPSIAPALCLAVWPVVAVPTWAALLGLIVLPLLSGGGFLVDVGRYLLATR